MHILLAEMDCSKITSFTVDELCDFLVEQNQEADVIETLKRNRVSGSSFLGLTKEHLKELFPSSIGDRITLSQLLEKIKESNKQGQENLPCVSLYHTPYIQ